LSLLRCTLGGNSAQGGAGGTGGTGSTTGGTGGTAFGAGLASTGIATLTNCTLAANSARGGGGGRGGHNPSGTGGLGGLGGTAHGAGFSSDSGSAFLASCTISSNQPAAGNGGLGGTGSTGSGGSLGVGSANSGGLFSAGNVQVQNSILAGNLATTYPDVNGTVQSGGFNLVGISDGSSGWLVGEAANLGNSSFPIDPKLGPLQNNGGPTLTMALLAGSPAIDKGSSPGLATDQRGRARAYDIAGIANASGGDGSDIGAFELNLPILNITRSANNVVLTWSTNDTGFTLQAKTNMNPSVNWSNALPVPVITGALYAVTNSAVTGSKFYRLRQ